ncbi:MULTISPECIES: DUF2089 domain-containing protein [Pseudothermotoga]|uniref:DUF2089 domain-containing protein n=1 Tax=Pseudothermotoga lettingae (strain ATCC BAA-301 / DSM 14385 / NBRC 107922 / TMO) TaxID=416591 RepID=A8F5E7_PSELT|nr:MULTISPECIES: DUF2089 domain-containing protein [Pseudothermotoga]ABV33381.1 conserved hypothetical protein [Pseudothermotoga lettingae TMO]GLI49704.1 hypothetical protein PLETTINGATMO_18730 [Pseudothermotoga lettingae TMO]HBJ81757.1 DUF2089 domain-containing protein [Pseudothermotoga sp.]HBT26300.1 DUF2089 domain-containing protein [Pseudothermotoga sp.]
MARVISKCPICGSNLIVTELNCTSCGTTIKGRFELEEFFRLTPDQLNFLRIFIKARGNLSDLQKELGISYPTAKSRLEGIVKTLGYEAEEVAEEKQVDELLDKLEKGEISAQEALEKIRRLRE